MNSIEMTSNIPTKADGQNTMSTFPKDAPIQEEFSFNSSNKMKITNHLSKFRWFGAAIILLVTIVTFSTIIHTSKLKEASRKRAATLNEAALSQIQGKDSELVLNGNTDEVTTMLWSREDSESSDEDDDEEAGVNNGTSIKKAGKLTTETRQLEVNGSIFKDAWRAMRTKTSKFVVLRQNIWNPRLVDAKLGQWSRTFIDFKTEIPATEAAIGFIYLGNTGQERFYEVVYIPSDMDVQPADIVAKYGLPSDPNELAKVSGCPVANTIVIRNFRDLNALNIMKNAKAGAVVSLWSNEDETESSDDDEEEEEVDEVVASSAVLAADGATYASVWSAMKSKFNRFVVLRKNANKIEAKLGGWNALVSEFQAQFPANEEAVGFMILGSGSSEQLYEVVYVPSSKTTKPSQVLANFGLPSNPALLRSNGLKVANTLVVRNYRDINTNNMILNAKTAGIVSAWEEEGLVSLWWGSSEDSNDGSTYSEVWDTLKEKTKRFVIFRKNADNSGLVDVTYGDWNTTSADFASSFKVNKAQVGYIYLGTKNHEKLYEVVYAPVALRTNPATILVSFGLPPNPSNLAQFGLEVPSTFVTTDKKQIDTGNIIMKAVNGGIISAWSSEEEVDEVVASSAVLAADGANYAPVWNTIKARTNRFVVFRKNAATKQIEAKIGTWNTMVSDFQAQFPADQEAVGFIVLGSGAYEQLFEVVFVPSSKSLTASQVLASFNLPTNPALLRSGLQVADTLVVKNYKDITSTNLMMNSKKAGIISLWDEELSEVVESSVVLAADGANYASVWNTIKAKANRFVVFRKSAANPKQIEAKIGNWNTIVSDFQAQFPADQEAVGFIVLGSGAYEQLFEVVFVPSGKSLTAAQVLASFNLPANPALLKSGLQVADTLVVRNYKDITSTNIMLNSKKAGIVSLWDDEEEESSDDEVEEVVESTQVLAADGANYATLWNELKGKTKRFVVFRKNANNPKQIEAKIGGWNTIVSDFQTQFPVDQEAVGFMVLGSDLNPQLYEVVYIPSTRNISPAQVVANFGLPADPALLKSNGLQVANTVVIRNYNDINTMNMVLNSKQGGVISLWDESARVLAADGANYASVWNTIKAKANRFVVFRKSAANPKQIEAKIGNWNTIVSDFQAQFPADQEAVGFIVLGSGAYEQLFEVVFVPSGKSLTASQVLASFNLPTNPALLKSGLQVADTLVVRSYKDITSTNIMLNSKKAGIISAWEEEEENDSDSTDDGESETEGEVVVQQLWWSSSEDSNDGSAYSEVWNTLKERNKKFVIFRKNAENAQLVDVTYGDWNTTSADFASAFKVNKAQVGYAYLGTKNHEKLYEVVYAPVSLRTNPATILVSFGLPPNPNNLAQFGLEVPATFVTTDKKQIDTGNIIQKATPAGIVS